MSEVKKLSVGYDEEMQQAARSAAAATTDGFWDEVQQLQNERHSKRDKNETPLVSKRVTT